MHGFTPDIYRILGKYSLQGFLSFKNTEVFLRGLAWKHMVRKNIDTVRETDWLEKDEKYISVNNILGITQTQKEYIIWEVGYENSKYVPFIHKKKLGTMFTGRGCRTCYLCHDTFLCQTEHILHKIRQFQRSVMAMVDQSIWLYIFE